jgi:hypothetical protein
MRITSNQGFPFVPRAVLVNPHAISTTAFETLFRIITISLFRIYHKLSHIIINLDLKKFSYEIK